MIDRPQAEKDVLVLDEAIGLIRQSVQGAYHQRPVTGILDQLAALLDHRACERFNEATLGQDDLDRLALTHVAGMILGDKGHDNLHAGIRMGTKLMKARCL